MSSQAGAITETDHQGSEIRVAVTGAASGIGRATASRFAASGARVALLDVNAEALAAVMAELPGTGHLALACDVAVRTDIQAAGLAHPKRSGDRLQNLGRLVQREQTHIGDVDGSA